MFTFIAIPSYTKDKVSGMYFETFSSNFSDLNRALLDDSFHLGTMSKFMFSVHPVEDCTFTYVNIYTKIACDIICPGNMFSTYTMVMVFRNATDDEIKRLKENHGL